jgi:DNA replication and repair protein RecF
VFHVEPRYLRAWREYRRILGQRNALLRQTHRRAEEAVWDEALVRAGMEIHERRTEYVANLSPLIAALGARLLGRPLFVDYRAGWRGGASLAEALRESESRDRDARYTQVGPHRADLEVSFTDALVRDAASRGQQKLVVAALILAQVAAFAKTAGYGGTLLVDDPSAELDADAVDRLRAELLSTNAQLVITGLSRGPQYASRADFRAFHVEQGEVRAML